MDKIPKAFFARLKTINEGPVFVCSCCGARTVGARPTETICNTCEAHLTDTSPGMPEPLRAALPAINSAVQHGDTQSIDAFYIASAKQQASDPAVLYGLGVLYQIASEHKYHSLNYSREGFMEENSANIASALALTSKFKVCFSKLVGTISSSKGYEDDSELLYMNFMSNIKIGRLSYAKKALDLINDTSLNESRKGSVLQVYCNMVYAVNTRSPAALQYIQQLVNVGEPNAFYYIARHLAQSKQFEEAIEILQDITGKMSMPMAASLLRSLKELKEKTRL